jgi:Clp amino terminal domain, pathogenicity island component
VCDDQHVAIALPKPDRPVAGWDSVELLEPLLDEAQHQATELGHDYIGSEHLVLAIAKLAEPRLRLCFAIAALRTRKSGAR